MKNVPIVIKKPKKKLSWEVITKYGTCQLSNTKGIPGRFLPGHMDTRHIAGQYTRKTVNAIKKVKKKMNNRVVAIWNNGTCISTMSTNFQEDLDGLVEQYGPPDKIEFRSERNEETERRKNLVFAKKEPKPLKLTECDKQVLEIMEDGRWYHSFSHELMFCDRPRFRLDRLYGAGLLEIKKRSDVYEWDYRIKQ